MNVGAGACVASLAAVLAWAGCKRSEIPAAEKACPTEEGLMELHAAAFHFQHSRTTTGLGHLQRARGIIHPTDGAPASRLLGKLTEISTLIERERDRAAGETEDVRLALSEWSCLPPELHRRLHAALPPLR